MGAEGLRRAAMIVVGLGVRGHRLHHRQCPAAGACRIQQISGRTRPFWEIFYLKDLAEDCAADKVYEFMFVAPAIPITGAVGSPTNPFAITSDAAILHPQFVMRGLDPRIPSSSEK
jgi:hypothetical protein